MKLNFFWLFTAVLLLAGCGGGQDLESPPDIRYGEDVCDECSMIISEAPYAASYVTRNGDVRRFDDIGGMLAYDAKHAEEVHIFWVHDHATEAWIKADDATYVLNETLTTPMGWGLAAFSHQADAEQFIADNGGMLTAWGTLQTAVARGELDPASLNAHIHQHEHETQDHMDPSPEHDMEHNHSGG